MTWLLAVGIALADPGPWTDDAPAEPLAEEAPAEEAPEPTPADLALTASDAAPDDAALAALAGVLLSHEGRFAESLDALDRAIRLDPAHVDAHLQRVRVLAWSGDLDAARLALADARARFPDSRESRWLEADLLGWSGDPAGALALLLAERAAHPADPELIARIEAARTATVRGEAATRVKVGDVQGAGDACRRVLAENPGDVDCALTRARALTAERRLKDALAVIDAALAENPDHEELATQRVRLLSWMGDWDEAVAGLASLRGAGADVADLASQVGLWRREDERWGPALSPPGRFDVVYAHTFVDERTDWDLFGVVGSWRHDKTTAGVGFYAERRVYGGPVADFAVEVPFHTYLSPRWRLQAIVGASPGATFRPRWLASVEPSVEITRAFGLGVGYRYSHHRSGGVHRVWGGPTITVSRVSVEPSLAVTAPQNGSPILGQQLKAYFWPIARLMGELWISHGADPINDTLTVFELVPAEQIDVAVGLRVDLTERLAIRGLYVWTEPLNRDASEPLTRRHQTSLQLTQRVGRKPKAEAVL